MNLIGKNYIYSIISEILIILIPLVTSPYISRILGATQIGVYTYCYSIVSYFILFAKMGINNHGSRRIASAKVSQEKNKIFSNIIVIQIILSIIALFFYFIYILYNRHTYHTISMIMVIYIVASLFDINWFFMGIENFRIIVVRNIIIKIIGTILLFCFIKKETDLWKYVIILGLNQLIGQISVWSYLKRYVKFIKPSILEIKRQLKSIFLLFIPQIAVSIYKLMDKIMLGYYCTKDQLGYYEYATIIVNLPLGFITSLGVVMLPRVSSMLREGEIKKTKQYLHYSLLFVIGLSSAFMFGLSAISPTFIPFYFGKNFEPASDLVIGLSITLIFLSWANVIRTQYLIPNEKDKEYILSLIIGAIVNLCLNIKLIPLYEAKGAVIGTIIAEAIVCIVQTYSARKDILIFKYIKECFIFFIIGIIMFYFVRYILYLEINLGIKLMLGIILGAIIYISLGLIYMYYVLRIPIKIQINKKSKL